MELYLTHDLHQRAHHYQNLGQFKLDDLLHHRVKSVPVVTISDQSKFVHIDAMTVVRPGHSLYNCFFSKEIFATDIRRIIQFIIKNGCSQKDSVRSSGWRIEFGCAGQAQEEGFKGTDKPKRLCGTSVFQEHPDGLFTLSWIGKVVDSMCQSVKKIGVKTASPHHLNLKRFNEYANHLRKFIYAKSSFVEWIAIQLLCITEGQSGHEHHDTGNDSRQGFNRCFTKVS